jgi:hypothetical protein
MTKSPAPGTETTSRGPSWRMPLGGAARAVIAPIEAIVVTVWVSEQLLAETSATTRTA